ncbi:MAG: hypothetical protein KGJ43_09075, partial [Acidobacteriota bacterium]|nr:hypothetical protein [Acidobacteriota bacterium]
FLLLTLPASRVVVLWPEGGVGVIGRDGRSLAYLPRSAPARRIATFLAHGGTQADEELAAAVARWDALRRPGPEGIGLNVDHERHGPVPRMRIGPALEGM